MIFQKIDNLGERVKKTPVLRNVLDNKLFVYLYFVVCFLQSIPLIEAYVSPVSKLFFLWAVLLLVWDLLYTRRIFRMSGWALPLLFLAAFAVSILINASEVLVDGCKHFIHCGIFMLLIYEAFAGESRQVIMK